MIDKAFTKTSLFNDKPFITVAHWNEGLLSEETHATRAEAEKYKLVLMKDDNPPLLVDILEMKRSK